MLALNSFTSRSNWHQYSLRSLLFLMIFSTPESGKSCRSSPHSSVVCWENGHNFCLFGCYKIGSRGPDWLQILHSPSIFPVLELQACTRMPSNFHKFLTSSLIIMFIGPNYCLISISSTIVVVGLKNSFDTQIQSPPNHSFSNIIHPFHNCHSYLKYRAS